MSFGVKQNELQIVKCGTDFINGVYMRYDEYNFIKECVHPYSKKHITLKISKITDLSSISSVPLSLLTKLNNSDKNIYKLMDKNEIYLISCENPCIHYYLCIVKKNNKIHQWLNIAALEPNPVIAPINNIKHYFDFPFNYDYNKLNTKAIKQDPSDLQLVKTSSIHSHFKKYSKPIKTSWIMLDRGLKGGQCLKIDTDQNIKIWNVLREIGDMNNISPWNVRMTHISSGLYVHYLWNYKIDQIIELMKSNGDDKENDIINNSFAYFTNKNLICYFSQYDDTFSFQSRYLKCNENENKLKNIINQHQTFLDENKDDDDKDNEFDDDIKRDELWTNKYKEVEQLKRKQDAAMDDKNKHSFLATRVWDKKKLIIYFGDQKYNLLLEECSISCKCWTDDIAGCRIACIIEYCTKLKPEQQGWIINGQIIDYFDENIAQIVWNLDAQIIVFKKIDDVL